MNKNQNKKVKRTAKELISDLSKEKFNEPQLPTQDMEIAINDPFDDLSNTNFNKVIEIPKPPPPEPKEIIKYIEVPSTKGKKGKKSDEVKQDDANGLFSDEPSNIYGREKLVLISKINQYKSLFPDKLKTFKIKKNPSLTDLQIALDECTAIVETDNVEKFMTDSIIEIIRLTETTSTQTDYDISGMAEMLKMNKQFHSLCKQIYIKHKVFAQIPPEYQMLMLISVTACMARQKNVKKKEIMAQFESEPIIIEEQIIQDDNSIII